MFQVTIPVTFKVFTHWDGYSRPEVRRFTVAKHNIARFQNLNAKLHEVFPGLKTKTYSVTWKDEDGDDITISSDQEVESILSNPSGIVKVFKLNVYVNEGEENRDECDVVITAVNDSITVGPPNLCHRGVKCDGCDSSVVGFRYKCASCDDFDLCAKCEASGIHPGHCMVRIPSPVMPHAMIKSAIKKSRHFLKTFAYDNSSNGRPSTSSLGSFATILNELANLACLIDQNEGKRQENLETSNTKRTLNKETLIDCGTKTNQEKETGFKFGIEPKGFPVTKDNGKQNQTGFSGFPFGTPPPGQASSCPPAESTLFPPIRSFTEPKVAPHGGGFLRPPAHEQQFGIFRPTVNGASNWPNSGAQLCVEGRTKHHPFGSPNGFGTSNVFGSSQNSSCMLFSTQASQPEPIQVTMPEPAPTAEPEPASAPEVETTPHHPQPHIDNAIKQMLAMGFTNEGGWLTQLVEREDGDIAAVLEYIPQPHSVVQSNNNANSSMV